MIGSGKGKRAAGFEKRAYLHADGSVCEPPPASKKDAKCTTCSKKSTKDAPLVDMSGGSNLADFVYCHDHFVVERVAVLKEARDYHIAENERKARAKAGTAYSSPSKRKKT